MHALLTNNAQPTRAKEYFGGGGFPATLLGAAVLLLAHSAHPWRQPLLSAPRGAGAGKACTARLAPSAFIVVVAAE
jgi:hypothetical protein